MSHTVAPDPGQTIPASPAETAPPAPGRGLAIAGLVLAVVAPLIGLILSLVAAARLRRAGAPQGLAVAGIVIGAVLTIVGIIVGVTAWATLSNLLSLCAELGPGVWDVDGVTYTCS